MAATVFYAACVAGAGLMELAVWLYAIRARTWSRPASPPRSGRDELAQLLPTPVVFLLSIPVAFVAPGLAPFTWILLRAHRPDTAPHDAGPEGRTGAAASA